MKSKVSSAAWLRSEIKPTHGRRSAHSGRPNEDKPDEGIMELKPRHVHRGAKGQLQSQCWYMIMGRRLVSRTAYVHCQPGSACLNPRCNTSGGHPIPHHTKPPVPCHLSTPPQRVDDHERFAFLEMEATGKRRVTEWSIVGADCALPYSSLNPSDRTCRSRVARSTCLVRMSETFSCPGILTNWNYWQRSLS